MALSAVATNKPIGGWVDGCTLGWGGAGNEVAVAKSMTLVP